MVPLISIVIPAYNASRYIERCLYSILNQMEGYVEQIETIVVNDGSTDDTESIVKKIIELNPTYNINLITIVNGGLANARNVGLKSAKGEYFINLDVDDFLQIGIVKALVCKLTDVKPDCCFYGFQDFDEISGNTLGKYDLRFHYCDNPINGEDAFIKKVSKYIWICQGSACYRRKLLIDNDLFNIPGINQGEDFLFIMSFLACSSKVTSLPQIGVNISCRSDSMMHSSFNNSYLQVFSAIDELRKRIVSLDIDINKDELLEWVNIEYELERLAVTKKIILANISFGSIKSKYFELIPPKRKFKKSKLSNLKRIESWIMNHSLLVYCIATRLYLCVRGK